MYIGTSINDSPVIAAQAAAQIENGQFKAVTMTGDGVNVAQKGEAAVGLLIAETDDVIAAGDTVTVQIKDCGLWMASGAERRVISSNPR